MGSWGYLWVFLVGWIIGGFTIIPSLVWAFWTWGTADAARRKPTHEAFDSIDVEHLDKADDTERVRLGIGLSDTVLEDLKGRRHVPDVASGYFAVCREYVPGGINGKPPERTSPAGAVVATESPSVYQSMYRSIFDRNKALGPSIDNVNGKSKKARNVFYVVLRLGYLMLYDDSEQLDVRHVISLAHHNVDIYSGGDPIPEGELWIKRNCIRLTQRATPEQPSEAKPFFLFSDNTSEKEDFYHAMLHSQVRHEESCPRPPLPLKFNTPDLVRLVQQLHASEENFHSRWINALIGRLFLAIYKTQDVERMIWTKITKKIARVPKPALLRDIKVQKIDMGHLPPFITNPKLKELTVDGDLTVEADVSYKGNFRLEVSAVARIELGSRIKAREVTLVLATILKRLEGHVLLRIKPPPSNRMWITFETPPKMEFSLEPIVSSRQITYGVILRAIESRIREVVGETLVFPNWDDIPFSSTLAKQFRGGLWEEERVDERPARYSTGDPTKEPTAADVESDPEESESLTDMAPSGTAKGASTPSTTDTLSFRGAQSSVDSFDRDIGVSSSTDQSPRAKPRAMRSSSFASIASPMINANPAVPRADEQKRQHDAAMSMRTTMSKSPPSSPTQAPFGLYTPDAVAHESTSSSSSELDTGKGSGLEEPSSVDLASEGSKDDAQDASVNLDSGAVDQSPASLTLPNTIPGSVDRRSTINQSLSSATAVARKWITSRQNQNTDNTSETGSPNSRLTINVDRSKATLSTSDGLGSNTQSEASSPATSQATAGQRAPIGRGQPLPPPGTPLPPPPKPEKRTWSVPAASALASLARRKPGPAKQPTSPFGEGGLGHHHASALSSDSRDPTSNDHNNAAQQVLPRKSPSVKSMSSMAQPGTPPPLPKRRQRVSVTDVPRHLADNEMLVVEAPPHDASAPASPTKDAEQNAQWRYSSASEELAEGSGLDDQAGLAQTQKMPD